jgi:hypothetical protein
VDSHGVYQGQWKKRHVYYKKCAYKLSKGPSSDAKEAVVEIAEVNEVPKSGCLIID